MSPPCVLSLITIIPWPVLLRVSKHTRRCNSISMDCFILLYHACWLFSCVFICCTGKLTSMCLSWWAFPLYLSRKKVWGLNLLWPEQAVVPTSNGLNKLCFPFCLWVYRCWCTCSPLTSFIKGAEFSPGRKLLVSIWEMPLWGVFGKNLIFIVIMKLLKLWKCSQNIKGKSWHPTQAPL